jgi:hypothetical protein
MKHLKDVIFCYKQTVNNLFVGLTSYFTTLGFSMN